MNRLRNERSVIKIGIGLDAINFGMDRKGVKSHLGIPTSIEHVQYLPSDPDYVSELWNYESISLTAEFESEEDYRLTTLIVESQAYSLLGHALVGESYMDALAFLQEQSVDYVIDDISTEEISDHTHVSIEIWNMDFWFIDRILERIAWGPLWKDEDAIEWP